jgi:hypothetical protein
VVDVPGSNRSQYTGGITVHLSVGIASEARICAVWAAANPSDKWLHMYLILSVAYCTFRRRNICCVRLLTDQKFRTKSRFFYLYTRAQKMEKTADRSVQNIYRHFSLITNSLTRKLSTRVLLFLFCVFLIGDRERICFLCQKLRLYREQGGRLLFEVDRSNRNF